MYLCTYIYYTYMYNCIYICIYVYMFIYKYIYIHMYIHMYTYIYMYICTYVYIGVIDSEIHVTDISVWKQQSDDIDPLCVLSVNACAGASASSVFRFCFRSVSDCYKYMMRLRECAPW